MTFHKESGLSDKAAVSLLLVICILCIAPFANKAFHMDDPLFIYAAKHIQANPLDFYGFPVNWYGFEMPMFDVTKNPPLASYYIALVALLFGWSEIALHLAFLIPVSAVVVGTFFLAKEFCDRPFWAALVGMATPVFLLSSTTVMCDTLMLSLWVWAIYFWRRGMKENSSTSLAIAALLIAACSLTKYFGISLIPLLVVYSLMEKRKAGGWMLFMLIPVLTLAVYQWYTHALYGTGLLRDAASYASFHQPTSGNFLAKILTGVAFAGGCFITTFLYAPTTWRKKISIVTAVSVFVIILAVQHYKTVFAFPATQGKDINWLFLAQFYLFICSGVFFISLVIEDVRRESNADSLLLFLWTMGTIVFACLLNWSVNARSLLPAAPAFGMLMMRRMSRQKTARGDNRIGRFLVPLALALLISLAVTWADYRLANTARSAALEIHDAFKNAPGDVWFQGHWGFQYYMERVGGKALDVTQSRIRIGDIMVIPKNNTNTIPMPPELVSFLREFQYDAGGFLTTMNIDAGAGFYMDTRGPMPYALAYHTVEKYGAFRIVR
jgi:4-amino-4-deoxy-L-arabinose transferase-like glycosyltransferase